jgi:hypothetical protein
LVAPRALPASPTGIILSSPGNDNLFTKDTLKISWQSGSISQNIANDKYKVEWDTSPTFDSVGGKPISFSHKLFSGTSPEVFVDSGFATQVKKDIQTITTSVSVFDGSVSLGGTFTISATAGTSTTTTSGISANGLTASGLQTALRGLSNIDDNLVVTRSLGANGGFTYTVTFTTEGNGIDLPLMTADTTLLTGTNAKVAIAEVQKGQSLSTTEVQEITIKAGAADLSGTFKISYNGDQTSALAFNVAQAGLANAMQSELSDISAVSVTRTDATSTQSVYRVTFSAEGYGNDLALLTIDSGSLGGTTPSASVKQLVKGEFSFSFDAPALGTPYYVRITGHNSLGYGTPSTAKLAKPFKLPTVPLEVSLAQQVKTAGIVDYGKQLVVGFNPPASTGGDTVTKYRVEWITPQTEVQVINVGADSTLGGNLQASIFRINPDRTQTDFLT